MGVGVGGWLSGREGLVRAAPRVLMGGGHRQVACRGSRPVCTLGDIYKDSLVTFFLWGDSFIMLQCFFVPFASLR